MALFNKIFSSKRKNNSTTSNHNTSQFPFNTEQVRILFYRECDWRGRRLLFDSNAIQRVQISSQTTRENKNCFIEVSDGFGYKYSRPNADSLSLGEMVFGSVAMSYRGTALKVHWLQSPNRILCSQVFLSPIRTNTFSSTAYDSNNTSSDISSVDTSSVNSFSLSVSVCVRENLNSLAEKSLSSNPVDVSPPSSFQRSSTSSENSSNRIVAHSAGDSGYTTDPWNISTYYPYSSARSSFGSVYSDQENIRKSSIDSITGDNNLSDGNIHRRIFRNLSTSFENKFSVSDFIGYISDNIQNNSDVFVARRRNSEVGDHTKENLSKKSKASDTAVHYNSCPGTQSSSKMNIRRAKLGLAICITFSETMEEDMAIFCAEHIALLEAMLCRLRATAEKAYINRQNFYQIMLRGWHSTSSWIGDLFKAPRINNPVWLTLNSDNTTNLDALAHKFMNELCWLLNSADTKDTNFFISTLVTAILTNHLGWVGTVAPLINSSNNEQLDTTIPIKISEISKSHPYSALWAQIGDLYGSNGSPSKISKTIICGKETHILEKILNVLTYFIRCGEIKREFKDEVIDSDLVEDIMNNINDNYINELNADISNSEKFPQSPTLKNFKDNKLSIILENGNTPLDIINEKNGNISINSNNKLSNGINTKGIIRSSTCLKDLRSLGNQSDNSDNCSSCNSTRSNTSLEDQNSDDIISVYKKNVMNDIPNVFAYRDSRFVKQEIRNGNYLMDTGIEMNEKLKTLENRPLENIRLTLTNPDNVELNLFENQNGNDFISKNNKILIKLSDKKSETRSNDERMNLSLKRKISNKKSGVVFVLGDDEELVDLKNSSSLKKSIIESTSTLNNPQIKLVSCSLECVKDNENNSIEIQSNGSPSTSISSSPSSSVQFFKSASSVSMDDVNLNASNQIPLSSNNGIINGEHHKLCKHKYKKHSGVKFNFEQYPQIATNYMKNKNLDISNYNFLEKGLKIEKELRLNNGASTSTLTTPQFKNSTEDECDCCRNGNGSHYFLTTPSNASELEFSCDSNENNYSNSTELLTTPTNATELEYSCDNDVKSSSMNCLNKIGINSELNKNQNRENNLVSSSVLTSNSSLENENRSLDNVNLVENNKLDAKQNKKFKFLYIPLPKSKPRVKKKLNNNKNLTNSSLLIFNPGFIPSLFINVTDHYIPDMVLQGTSSSPSKWETSLKNDLVLSSHCCIIEQTPTENVAIIGDTDKWDVRLVSSQTLVLPSGACSGGPVGMSQLVASMLETVHAMWGAGTSAFHCISFMESKLQEMYFQSETLAAFLLDTEFCSLNKLTSTLNLSANDVPFLLSVASVHSPQVTKKYGISFR